MHDTQLLEPDQISHTQSTEAKRGLTDRANAHTGPKIARQNSNRASNLSCNWTSFHSKNTRKLKMLTHGSKAKRAETRNRGRPFLALL